MQENMRFQTESLVTPMEREGLASPQPLERERVRSLSAEIWRKKIWYLFLLPTFVFLIIFMYYPILAGFFYSVFEWKGIGKMHFVGLGNFQALLQDEVFLSSFSNIFKMTLIHLIINLTAPLLAAKAITGFRQERYRFFYRVVFTVPMVVPWMVNILIWKFIYSAEIGVLNQLLIAVGLERFTHAWLSEVSTALYAIALMGFPWISGLYFLIYYAGLINIPHELIDAAHIDGASGFRIFASIEIPLIRGQIKLIMTLTLINWIQNYASVLVMTRGGPFQTTMVPGLWMYINAFDFSEFGYGSAIGVILFLIISVVTFISNKLVRSNMED